MFEAIAILTVAAFTLVVAAVTFTTQIGLQSVFRALLFWVFWNESMPTVFGVHELTFMHSFCLVFMAALLLRDDHALPLSVKKAVDK